MMRRIFYIALLTMMTISFGTACSKKTVNTETSVQVETTESRKEETTVQAETEASTEASSQEENGQEESGRYHMLQGTIIKAAEDGSVFTLKADDGKEYEIPLSQIGDVETEIEANKQIAVAWIGEEGAGLEDMDLVLALPEQEEWSILTETGTTTSNSMSTFSVETRDGREISFIKDNCLVEDGALSSDSGDEVEVVYVTSQGFHFPLEIKKAGK